MKNRGKIYLYVATVVCIILLCLTLAACAPIDQPLIPTPPSNIPSEKPTPDAPPVADKLTIYYNDMGSSTSIEYINQDVIVLLVLKPRTGYSFLYWLAEDGSPILSSSIYNNSSIDYINLSAAWAAVDYTLTLKYNDSSEKTTAQNYNIESNEFLLPNPSRTGYDFLGWFNGNHTSPISSIKRGTSGNLSLNAKWKTQTYTITFSNVEESFSAKEEYNINTNDFTLPIPAKERCEFLGWYFYNNLTGERIFSVPKGSSGDLTLFAKWSAPNYKISYELYGGSGIGLINNYSLDTLTVNLEKTLPAKASHKFIGWYQHPDCTANSLVKAIAYTDTTDYKLYAAWTSDNATANIEYSHLKCTAPNKDSLNPSDHDACHYTVLRAAAGAGNIYNIANSYKSRPVTAIDRLAFQALKSVTINVPINITAIADEAFRDCSNTTIYLPTKLKTIGKMAFYKTNSVTAIIPPSVEGGLGDGCFAYSKNCSFTISEGITSVPYEAFFSATANKIFLPVSVEYIGDRAFAGTVGGTTLNGTWIKLGGKVKYWGGGLFANSKISRLDIDRAQQSITYTSLFDLYNIDSGFSTPISLSLALTNYITSEIYFRIMGFYNPSFNVKFDCSTVNDNPSLLGHYSSNEFTHSQEEVCISRKYDNNADGIKNNYILDLKSINTIVHETRHYFQNLCYKGAIKSIKSAKIPNELMPSANEIRSWNPANYISATGAPEKYAEYYHQPVEEDARLSATEITGYLPKHEHCLLCPPKSAYLHS